MNERELKFRIWVHIDKAFTYFNVYDYPSGIAFGVSYPMQSIGLVDEKGVTIFEGDIVGVATRLSGDQYTDFIPCAVYHDFLGFNFKLLNGTFDRNILVSKDSKFEIIGNIIEHKHLLP